jgi:membrane fusion protein, multidrug efflux system
LNIRMSFPGFAKPRRVARFFLVGFLFLGACSGSPSAEEPKSKERLAVPVLVAAVFTKDVPIQVSSVGNVEAYSTVAVKSRVSGELVGVHFPEGQEVREGDLLLTIDKAPYEVALKEAQARLERDQALARKARDDVRRNMPLAEKDIVSRQSLDQYVSTAEAAEALVKADQAAVENLRLQLGYCSIHSPISGRTGSLMIQKGNLVKANDENKSLVTVHQIEPIYVTFAVPEKYLGEINRRTKEGKMEVQVYTHENPAGAEPVTGFVSFVNNAVEQTTATIRLKATVQNRDRRLWPGQTINVLLTLGVQPKAVVVPSQAVQSGQSGSFAFVVRQDQTAELRPVTVSRSTNGETVIEKGLSAGETVVTDGHLLLTSGARVSVRDQNPVRQENPKK